MLSWLSKHLHQVYSDVVYLFAPDVCLVCGESLPPTVQVLCPVCMVELPYTHSIRQENNKVEQNFWGRVQIEKAFALLYFDKGGNVQKLMHMLKYKNQPEVGVYLGKLMGQALKRSTWGNEIDYIVPLPLHPGKYKKRGYNQSEVICTGISEVSGKELNIKILRRSANTVSQTRKSRTQRWDNVKEAFELDENIQIHGRKILLVDDVITTGATLEAAAQHLTQAGAKVYVGVLAMAI